MTHPAEDLLDGIRVILRTFTVNETRYPAAEGKIKYNAIDFQTLHFVSANSGCSGMALSGFLGVAPTTTQSVCDRLIRQGFIERETQQSKRSVAYRLTKSGADVVGAIQRQDLLNCQTMLNALPQKSRRRFAADVLKIANQLTEQDRS